MEHHSSLKEAESDRVGTSLASDLRWRKMIDPDEAPTPNLSQELVAPWPLDHVSVIPPAVHGEVSLTTPRGR